jgi:8-oxo-dGTP diphosphatase
MQSVSNDTGVIKVTRFNIRVYILLLDEHDSSVLLSDEIVDGEYITKFPGGGLEMGEGILDCLYREAGEELGQEVEVLRQFHTSETFQASRYRPGDQIICVYYTCRLPRNSEGRRLPVFRVTDRKFDFGEVRDRAESFRWQALASLQVDDLSLPLDRQIVSRLVAENSTPS